MKNILESTENRSDGRENKQPESYKYKEHIRIFIFIENRKEIRL